MPEVNQAFDTFANEIAQPLSNLLDTLFGTH